MLAHRAKPRVQEQIARCLFYLDPFCAAEVQPDLFVIGIRRNDEIVFELLLIAVKDQVNPGINVLVFHFRKSRNICLPFRFVVTDKIVDLTFLLFQPFRRRIGVGTGKFHSQNGRFGLGHFGFWLTHLPRLFIDASLGRVFFP